MMDTIKTWATALVMGFFIFLVFYVLIFINLAVTGDYTTGFRLMTGLEEDSATVTWILGLTD